MVAGKGLLIYTAKEGRLVIPDTVKTIVDAAVGAMTSVSEITISASVTKIGRIGFGASAMIRGYRGTAAEAYAAARHITFEELPVYDRIPAGAVIDQIQSGTAQTVQVDLRAPDTVPEEVFRAAKGLSRTLVFNYFYHADKGEPERVAHDIQVRDGYAVIRIEHCSDYILTEKEIRKEGKNNSDESAPIPSGSETSGPGASDLPPMGDHDMPAVWVGFILLSVGTACALGLRLKR